LKGKFTVYNVVNTGPTPLQRMCEDLEKLTFRDMMQLASVVQDALIDAGVADENILHTADVAIAISVAIEAIKKAP
jgi:hypothetical protein